MPKVISLTAIHLGRMPYLDLLIVAEEAMYKMKLWEDGQAILTEPDLHYIRTVFEATFDRSRDARLKNVLWGCISLIGRIQEGKYAPL